MLNFSQLILVRVFSYVHSDKHTLSSKKEDKIKNNNYV